jgi:hypothetical protein
MKMSKQNIAKAAQNYQPKPVRATCSNCRHFDLTVTTKASYGCDYTEEKARCSLGGFAVLRLAVCDRHEPKG